MYGAIIGDIAGSFYETLEYKAHENNDVRSSLEKVMVIYGLPLFNKLSSCTDASILTCAVADAILSNSSYEEKLKEYGLRELSLSNSKGFGKDFVSWLKGNHQGTSYGNGCAMRIGPVGYLFDTLEDVKNETYKATFLSHNHPESLRAAEAISTSIFLLRKGMNKEKLKEYIEDNYYSFNFDMDKLIKRYKFTYKASDSVPQAIYCFLESQNFEDAIRKAISIGGDSDTIACITGSLAEAYYGVPEDLIEIVRPYLKDYMLPVLERFYQKPKINKL